MQSTPIIRILLACAALTLPMSAQAQDEAQDPTQEQAPEAEPLTVEPTVGEDGDTFVAETYQDWQILCGRLTGSEQESCEMYQLLETEDGPIAEIAVVALPEGSGFPAGTTITTPLETFLPAGVSFRIDTGQTRQEPFLVCTVVGCIARIGLEQAELDAMRRGVNAFVTISAIGAPDQPIEIPVSLMGFTAAMEDLQGRMAE